jgi:molybdopterin molybdotransferase
MTGLSARDAALDILHHITPQPGLRVPLDEALGSVLAEDIVAPIDLPPHTNSAMDGYAVRGQDVRGATGDHPVRLRVVQEIAAGKAPAAAIGPGEAARIFTGGRLPAGADSVIRQEDTDRGTETVAISSDRDAGVNWRKAGEDLARGDLALSRGTVLGAAGLGLLASLAVAQPLVYRRPRVAILAGGDEIVDVDQADQILSGEKIASSNTHSLIALVRDAGGEPLNLGIAADSRASLREHLERSRDCDLVVTTAGISVGERDYLRPVIEEMGGVIRFWRLRLRPGAPVGFGLLGDLPWIGLPGNPVSTMVTFELLVRPAIRKMSGHALPFRRAVPVRMAEAVTVPPRLQHFLRAVVSETPEGRTARLTGPQGSGILTSMVRGNALLVIPEGQVETAAGSVQQAILRDDPVHQEQPPF